MERVLSARLLVACLPDGWTDRRRLDAFRCYLFQRMVERWRIWEVIQIYMKGVLHVPLT